MADEIVCKRGEDRAPGAATRERDEILGRLSPAFRLVVEFVREQKNSCNGGDKIVSNSKGGETA